MFYLMFLILNLEIRVTIILVVEIGYLFFFYKLFGLINEIYNDYI